MRSCSDLGRDAVLHDLFLAETPAPPGGSSKIRQPRSPVAAGFPIRYGEWHRR
jgi:hypothetical protein